MGQLYGTATFGIGEANETTLGITGYENFLIRYNPDGSLRWAKSLNNAIGMRGMALPDNSTVVAGGFNTPVVFDPGEPNETMLTNIGDKDIFIARHKEDGSLFWVKQAGGAEASLFDAVTSLENDSIFLTGTFVAPVIFGPGEPNETILDDAQFEYGCFIAKYIP